jgi:hypothetical protein
MDISVQVPFNGWEPRPHQRKLWCYLQNGGKRAIQIAHRRWGKDEVALHFAMTAIADKPATYWHMLPIAVQGRRAIWEAVNPHTGIRRIDEVFPPFLRETTRENEMMIRFKNGATWYVVGSDAYDSLVGSPPAGVIYSEWALADPASWGFLRPILAENNGWAAFITTPRGTNHAKTMYDAAKNDPTWFCGISTALQTTVFTSEQLEVEKREYIAQFGHDQGIALYEQEYLCSFEAAVFGAFYAEELRLAREDGRIGRVPIDRTLPVHTAWDLGVTDATAIWFIQVAGREVRLVDYHEDSGTGLDRYVQVLDDKKQERGWRYGDGNNRAEHWFPHDVEVRELGTGVSRSATLRQMGVHPVVVPAANVFDGINATRRLLSRAWIDEERCARGLSALQAYRREWNESDHTFHNRPLHDWSSHGADALRTFAMGFGDDSGPVRHDYHRNRDRRFNRHVSASWMSA